MELALECAAHIFLFFGRDPPFRKESVFWPKWLNVVFVDGVVGRNRERVDLLSQRLYIEVEHIRATYLSAFPPGWEKFCLFVVVSAALRGACFSAKPVCFGLGIGRAI